MFSHGPLHHLDHFKREQDDADCLQQFYHCPACQKEFGQALILPCSHPMCSACVVAAERKRLDTDLKSVQRACLVMCPCCRGPVELPCWTWSHAASCLPQYPSLSSVSHRAASSDQNEKRDISSRDAKEMESNNSCNSPNAPLDGSIGLHEEEMRQSVYGLHFALDHSHISPSIYLSNSSLTATYQEESPPPTPGLAAPVQAVFMLRGDVVIRRGQFYWEVDICDSALYRIGVQSVDGFLSWWFERKGLQFSAVYDGTVEPIYTVPPGIKTIGLFLNTGGGVLSFYNALSQEHLVTMPTRFDSNGVVPVFGLGQGRLKLRTGLPPPPLVFHSKDSAYRGAQGTEAGMWRRGVPFGSVKKVVQKFEELAMSQ